MRIALLNENSQAAKNEIIFKSLKKEAEKYGHEVFNYGMYSNDDKKLTYVQLGLLAGILINSGAVDFVVTGCGTGQGAMLALNSFPNVLCGLVIDPTDAYLFGQINDGNAISLPYAKGFGWGSEVTLSYIFEKLFSNSFGGGYPIERKDVEQANKKILDNVKKITTRSMIDILKDIDKDFLKETIDRDSFKEYFFKEAKDKEIIEFVRKILL